MNEEKLINGRTQTEHDAYVIKLMEELEKEIMKLKEKYNWIQPIKEEIKEKSEEVNHVQSRKIEEDCSEYKHLDLRYE